MKQQYWLSAYVYKSKITETFLIKGIEPFLREVIDKGMANNFFFVRYFENGPHLRLRFKGEKNKIIKELKPQLIRYFSSFFSRSSKKSVKSTVRKNIVEFAVYEQEIERYGGDHAILIAEKQFYLSSKTVLSALKAQREFTYENIMGMALKMHITFSRAVGMNYQGASVFYNIVYKTWLAELTNTLSKSQVEIQNHFESNYLTYKPELYQLVTELYHDPSLKSQENWLREWLEGMQLIRQDLLLLQKERKIVIPPWFNNRNYQSIDFLNSEQLLWFIFISLVHMTNNRFGILNADESYQAYLLMRTFEDCAKNENKIVSK